MEQNMTNRMPVKAHPYDHQQKAYEFACRLFGLNQGGDDPPSIQSRGCALLMVMSVLPVPVASPSGARNRGSGWRVDHHHLD